MSDEKELSAGEKKKEDWMNAKWRPMMGWMYMLICTMDMVVFPVLWSLLQAITHTSITQWNPLTLQGAGLFHIAMGAVLGIAAFGRTQEKLNGANNGGAQTPTPTTGFTTGATTPSISASGGFSSPTPASSSFGGGGFGSASTTRTEPSFSTGTSSPAQVSTGWGGKPAPAEFQHPAI